MLRDEKYKSSSCILKIFLVVDYRRVFVKATAEMEVKKRF